MQIHTMHYWFNREKGVGMYRVSSVLIRIFDVDVLHIELAFTILFCKKKKLASGSISILRAWQELGNKEFVEISSQGLQLLFEMFEQPSVS